jgi:hypothetical protein
MPNATNGKEAPSPELLALSAIARSVAYLAMHAAELADSDVATKADFLERMGLGRSDCSKVLGTSEDSIRVALYAARNKAKPKKGVSRG